MSIQDSYQHDLWGLFGDDILRAASKVADMERSGKFDSLDSIERVACSIVDEAALRVRLGVDLDEMTPVLADAISTVRAC